MEYGYARTNTDDQTTALQLAALRSCTRTAHRFKQDGDALTARSGS